MRKEKLRELNIVSPKVRPYFSTQASRKTNFSFFNLQLRYSMPALLMLGLTGVKLGYTVMTLFLVGSSPLTDSGNYSIIFGGFILILLIFGGAFIGIALRKIIGVVVCLLGVIIDIIVRVITINELLDILGTNTFNSYFNWLMFDFLDVFLISLFLVGAFYTIRVFKFKNKKKLRLKKLCKNCSKFIADATPGICPHCGHLIGS